MLYCCRCLNGALVVLKAKLTTGSTSCFNLQMIALLPAADAQRKFCETEGYEGHSSNVLRTIGYFSLVGLLRVHCLLGEYETALKALGPINPFKTGNLLTPKVAGANIALYYYAGFSYLMLQRYLDATRAFNTVLVYINRYLQCYSFTKSCSPLCSGKAPVCVGKVRHNAPCKYCTNFVHDCSETICCRWLFTVVEDFSLSFFFGATSSMVRI